MWVFLAPVNEEYFVFRVELAAWVYDTHLSLIARAMNKYHGTVDKPSVFEILTGFSKVMLINDKSLKISFNFC